MLLSKVCVGHSWHHATSLTELLLAPWDLYIKARARRPPPEEAFDVDDTPEEETEATAKIRALARSELRFAELVSANSFRSCLPHDSDFYAGIPFILPCHPFVGHTAASLCVQSPQHRRDHHLV